MSRVSYDFVANHGYNKDCRAPKRTHNSTDGSISSFEIPEEKMEEWWHLCVDDIVAGRPIYFSEEAHGM